MWPVLSQWMAFTFRGRMVQPPSSVYGMCSYFFKCEIATYSSWMWLGVRETCLWLELKLKECVQCSNVFFVSINHFSSSCPLMPSCCLWTSSPPSSCRRSHLLQQSEPVLHLGTSPPRHACFLFHGHSALYGATGKPLYMLI